AARLQAIEWLAIPDEQERLDALESGRVHCLHGPVLREVERLRADPRFTVVEYPQCSNVYLGLNWDRPQLGFADVRVRRAFSLAIDRAAIVERALAGHGTAAYGQLGPGDPYYAPAVDQGRAHDPAAADALLDSAGWTRDENGIRAKAGQRLIFECVGQDDEVLRRLAETVRDQLAPRGIRLELRFVKPFADFYAACGVFPSSFIGKWLWPDGMDASILFTAGWNYPDPNWQHSRVPELDAAFGDWLRAQSEPQLQEAATRSQLAVADQLPYIPLVTPNDVWVLSRKLHGWRPPPENLYPFYQDTWLEE
ncbi:MAG TPA: ABC transporter substrate-binding protein, partial [Chloroflexota bacterium]|nr:ABC transporter substrate-binding protein [Chloroflexota bacterium]